jgi:hypothetical protein
MELAKLLPGLRTLHILVGSNYLTSRGLVQIANSAAQLTELHIGLNHLSEESFQHLFCKRPPLRKLKVYCYRGEGLNCVDSLAESLQFLDIYTDGKLGPEAMQAIGRLANLKSLVIDGGSGFVPQDFFDCVSRGLLLKLCILHLKNPYFATSENVDIVVMKCPELRELCLRAQHKSLDFSRVFSTSLRVLHISHCR